MNEQDDIRETVKIHDRLLRGDPENMKESPGLISDHIRFSYELGRTNEILTEVRDSLGRINWMLISAFVLGLIALVFKTVVPPS